MVDELVKGIVVNITRDGIFIEDGISTFFVYIGQITSERLEYSEEKMMLVTYDSKKPVVRIGSKVLGRIASVSYNPTKKEYEVDLTLMQKTLGIASF